MADTVFPSLLKSFGEGAFDGFIPWSFIFGRVLSWPFMVFVVLGQVVCGG